MMKINLPVLATFFAIFSSFLLSKVNAACVPKVSGGSDEVTVEDGTGVVDFLAGQDIDVGTISAEVSGDNLIVTFETTDGWYLEETHLWVGDDLNYPQTGKGNPKIGNFPYKKEFDEGVDTWSFEIPLAAIGFECDTDY